MENSIEKSLSEPIILNGFYGWQKKSWHLLNGKVYGATTMKRHDKTISCIATVGKMVGNDVFITEFGAEQIYGPKYLNKKATKKAIVEIHDEFIERNFKPVFV